MKSGQALFVSKNKLSEWPMHLGKGQEHDIADIGKNKRNYPHSGC